MERYFIVDVNGLFKEVEQEDYMNHIDKFQKYVTRKKNRYCNFDYVNFNGYYCLIGFSIYIDKVKIKSEPYLI